MPRRSTFVREQEIDILTVTEGAFNLDTGEYDPSTETAGIVTGSIQPIPGDVLERLPEGTKSKAKMSLWAHEPMNLKTIVLFKGVRFEIEEVDDWNNISSPIPHFMYVMLREDDHGPDIVGENNA
ncbi:MAG: hypothetical protein HRU26_08845 [Psychroserpens sp.]|nr:hypothetical protein [Psychroserpens sp.]